jgi:Transmembrane domain of unknown function (DUF3566)
MSDRARSSVRTEAREGSGTPDGSPEGAGQDGDRRNAAAGAPAGATAVGPDTPAAAGPPAGRTPEAEAPAPADEAPAAPAPPAAHPATPLGPTRPAGDGGRPPTTSGQPVAATTAAERPPVDSTQAVPLVGTRPDPASRPAAARPAQSARPAATEQAGRPGKRGAARGPRRARLQLRHIDTWSALKISLVLSIALFFVWMVAVGVLYGVLSGLGVFDTLNDLIGQLSTASGEEAGGGDVITAGVVFGGAAVIGAVNIVLLTALCTVTAFVYNLCSDLVGGLEVTLAERE